MELKLKGVPNEKQEKFFLAEGRHIAYGGARGGGKSWAMRRKFVLLALRYSGLKILLLRKTLPELRENHILPLMSELYGFAQYKDKEGAFIFPNGSRLKLGYCQHDKDVYQYQGQEYDVIGFEEATHFTEFQKDFITTCNRSTRTDFKPRIYYTSNPGNVGHAWFKRLFIDRNYRNKEKAEDYVFIPAKVYDNKVLMETNPEYVEQLENLPEEQRKAHLDGDWNVFAGQYFRSFRQEKHVIEPFQPPEYWKRYRSIDFGYNDHTAVYWHAVDQDGRTYTYRELYINETLASDIADMIVDMSVYIDENGKERKEDIRYTVASPDMWQVRGAGVRAKDGEMRGKNIADTFAEHGVPLIKADNARIIGWQRMNEELKEAPDGKPYWLITSNCTNLIRTIPEMIHDDKRVEDIADGLEDHAIESVRYYFMSRPQKAKVPENEKTAIQKHKEKLIKRIKNNRKRIV